MTEVLQGAPSIEDRVKKAIIGRLVLEVEPDAVANDAPLFAPLAEEQERTEDSMNLDSIDILEAVLGLNEEFGVELPDDRPEIFTSVQTLADYIREASTPE